MFDAIDETLPNQGLDIREKPSLNLNAARVVVGLGGCGSTEPKLTEIQQHPKTQWINIDPAYKNGAYYSGSDDIFSTRRNEFIAQQKDHRVQFCVGSQGLQGRVDEVRTFNILSDPLRTYDNWKKYVSEPVFGFVTETLGLLKVQGIAYFGEIYNAKDAPLQDLEKHIDRLNAEGQVAYKLVRLVHNTDRKVVGSPEDMLLLAQMHHPEVAGLTAEERDELYIENIRRDFEGRNPMYFVRITRTK